MNTQRISIISLWEPYAFLIVVGAKRNETRHWLPFPGVLKVGDLLGIQAAKRWTKAQIDICQSAKFRPTLEAHGITFDSAPKLPLGALLGVTHVVEFIRTEDALKDIHPLEYAFGNYEPDRYAWRLEVIHRYAFPIPMVGQQRIWKADVPDWEVIGPDASVQQSMFGD